MRKKNIQKNKRNSEPKSSGEIVIYKTPGKEIEVRVSLEKDTVWLTQVQIAFIFGTERSVITKHINNVFKSGELERKSNVQKMHIPGSDRPVHFYNLDVVISIGYRVNSKRATEFRIWATAMLRKYLTEGYLLNEKRLSEAREKFEELKSAIAFLRERSADDMLSGQEREILDLLSAYSKTLTLLEQYDKGKLAIPHGQTGVFKLSYEDAKYVVGEIKKQLAAKDEASDLFGQEYGGKLEGIVKTLYQTFDGKELYKTAQEKAAHLLYLTIKDHPFADGNKRVASFIFVYFLDKNGLLYRETGERKINDNALTALALLIAVSDPKEKDVLIKIVMNLLNT